MIERGPPECQEPGCTNLAVFGTSWIYCKTHASEATGERNEGGL